MSQAAHNVTFLSDVVYNKQLLSSTTYGVELKTKYYALTISVRGLLYFLAALLLRSGSFPALFW